ncbi:amino acid ABC transporter permease [Leucobacter sp. G161]|uniref:amino acid ABC transporter permease n=1 Tax=Leucobacter sp. G161 TaxID=663704 RepID=UPI00190FD22B|nr:amino acid ABC transporter permease [Leucobacter sp. G161]
MSSQPLNTTTLETMPGLRLSPPPRSRGLATIAVALSVAVLVGVGVLAATGLTAAEPGTTARTVGWIFVTAGLALTAIPVFIAIKGFRESLRSAKLVREDAVLRARSNASKSRELSLTALGLLVAVAVLTGFILLLVSNDASVQQTFLRWDILASTSWMVTKAFGLNIFIAIVAEIIVLIFGLALAIARMLPGRAGAPIRWLAILYIDVMRAVPAIIVIYLIGFGLPLAGIPILKDLSPTWFAIIALALTYSAYVAETYRAGIESIHASQFSASRSLGFSFAQTMRLVVLPQAVRNVIPPLLTMFIGLQKDTALVNVIGAMDAFNQAKYVSATQYNLSAVTIVAILFVIVTIPQTRLVDWWLERGKKMRGGS